MSDFLSQDDIDALLQGQADGSISFEEGAGGDNISSGDFADDVVKDFNDQQQENLQTLVGRDVECIVEEALIGDSETVNSKIGAEYVCVKSPLSGGVTGAISIIGAKQSFGILADLMVMGDGTAPYNEDSGDAVKEMYSTVAGSYATFLGGKCESSVSSDGIEVVEDTGSSDIVALDVVLVTVKITDIEPFPLLIVLDESLMKGLAPFYASEPEAAPETVDPFADDGLLSQDEIDSITNVTSDLSSIGSPSAPAQVATFSSQAPKVNVDLLLDIDLDVTIELGRTDISIKRVLELAPGSLVELDRLAGEPVDLLVNNKVVAKGEVVVVDENFGVRVISLVSPEERIKSLR